MDYQLWITGALVLLATGYCIAVFGKSLKAMRSGGCGNSCGCDSKPKEQPGLVQENDLTARLRNRPSWHP